MTSPVLWQNAEQTIILLDIPRSIAHAQGTVQHPCHDDLLSCQPLEASFPTNEPRSEKAKTQLQWNTVDEQLHGEYIDVLRSALSELRKNHQGNWCLSRPFTASGTKRKRCDGDYDGKQAADAFRTADAYGAGDGGTTLSMQRRWDGSLYTPENLSSGISIYADSLVSNDTKAPLALLINVSHGSDTSPYRIPPGASFYLGDCGSSQAFRSAVRSHADETNANRTFDLILLDPPWPNRSVKRTHKTVNSTYHIARDLVGISNLLFGLDLDMLMVKDASIGIWITNKSAIRELVLGEGGLFATWGIQLVEEWIWLKTTVNGEPVTSLESMWRKPYEVLLLGKRQQRVPEEVKRRVVVAVPDLHSRKPCLKELFKPLLPSRDCRVLEVFARHLVAGWTSWGDECVKFNETRHWRSPDSQPS